MAIMFVSTIIQQLWWATVCTCWYDPVSEQAFYCFCMLNPLKTSSEYTRAGVYGEMRVKGKSNRLQRVKVRFEGFKSQNNS